MKDFNVDLKTPSKSKKTKSQPPINIKIVNTNQLGNSQSKEIPCTDEFGSSDSGSSSDYLDDRSSSVEIDSSD